MKWARHIATGQGSRKGVLIALADTHHQVNNTCFASESMLVRFTNLNWKTIKKALHWLQDAGFITEEKRPGKCPNYRLHFDVTSSKIGEGKNAGNPENLQRTPSKIGGTTPSKIGEGAKIVTPSKFSTDPLQKRPEPPPNLEDEQENRTEQGKEPPIVPHDEKPEIANRVITVLNSKTGKRFRQTANNRKPIIARLNEGFTEHDCYRVITNRVMRWTGTEMAQYLRPDTLFRPSKFEGYLNDAGETGYTDQAPAYNPDETQRVIDQAFGADTERALPPGEGKPWTH